MRNCCLVFIKWIVLFFLIKGITCVKLVSLNVPSRVKKGSEVRLSCLYDLGNATLYSLKWFHRANDRDQNEQEFFRYTPRGKPIRQLFPLEGIKVDFPNSDGGTVTLSETNGKTSGNYKCEISVEGTFQTVFSEKLMTVEANRASLLSSSMDNKLMFILCTSCAILSWIVTNNSSKKFIITSSAPKPSIMPLNDRRTQIKYHINSMNLSRC